MFLFTHSTIQTPCNKIKVICKIFQSYLYLFQVNPNGYYTLLKQMGSKEVNEVKSYVSLWITKESDRKSLASDDQLKSLFQEDSIEVKVMNDLLSSEDLTYHEVSLLSQLCRT